MTIMSLLKYSRTWPSILASTMAVVQIRVDPKGRPYSSIISSNNNNNNNNLNTNNNNVVVEQEHEQQHISTDGGGENEMHEEEEDAIEEERVVHHHAIPIINIVSPYTSIETNDTQLCSSHLLNRLHVPNGGKFCYCSNERRHRRHLRPSFLRSESIKVENWDYIYTERKVDLR